jgi:alpha/beta superfamily hydrolase
MTSPLFFGDGMRRLFGVYSAPASARQGVNAVLICPPGPQEYMTTHWAIRRLATQLANAGAHVLRFDYFGTGDSAGASEDGTLEAWQADILTAADKLRELSRTQRVSVLGYRLGATLAWRASQVAATKPRDLVLWDPVIVGNSYLRELMVADDTFKVRLLYFPPVVNPPAELGGFVLPPEQYRATLAVNLLSEPLPSATRVHLIVGSENSENEALAARLKRDARRFTYVSVPEEQASGSGNFLPSRVLTAITAVLSSEAA